MPEADWIEQHQPVSDEDDADVRHTSEVREADDAVSIESDTPEADWIEQHQPIVEAPDEERLPSDDLPQEVVEAGEPEQDWITTDEDVGAADDQEIPTPPRPPELVAAMFSPPSRTPCCVGVRRRPAGRETQPTAERLRWLRTIRPLGAAQSSGTKSGRGRGRRDLARRAHRDRAERRAGNQAAPHGSRCHLHDAESSQASSGQLGERVMCRSGRAVEAVR